MKPAKLTPTDDRLYNPGSENGGMEMPKCVFDCKQYCRVLVEKFCECEKESCAFHRTATELDRSRDMAHARLKRLGIYENMKKQYPVLAKIGG